MLPTILRRWSWCYSYFVWLCSFYHFLIIAYLFTLLRGRFMLSLALLVVLVFSVLLALGSPHLGKRELVYVLLVHLFVYLHTLVFVPFLFLFMSEVGRGLWLGHSLDFSIILFRKIVGKSNFSEQVRKLINRYKRVGYNLHIIRQTACLVVNPITVDCHAFHFYCTVELVNQTKWRPQQWRLQHKAFINGLPSAAMSWAWPAVAQLMVFLSSGWQCW